MTKLRAALVRAARTALQTLIPSLGVNIATDWSSWRVILVTVAGATALSLAQGLLGALPEVE